MPLWAELNRRNVYKVGAVCRIVAQLIIQAVDIIFPYLNLPARTVK
jgi:hypothetical protein